MDGAKVGRGLMLRNGNYWESTPLGCRIVFGLAALSFLLFKLDHHDFVSFNLVCTPGDVVYGWQLQRLLFASVAHTSLFGLLLALLICWRRFVWLEHQAGTLGFLLWFVTTSMLLHGAYCLLMLFAAPVFGRGLLSGEVKGLFPLVTANLVVNSKDNDSSTVWLWPLPFHVSVRAFPPVVIMASWVLHMDAHLDVVVAYVLAVICPPSFFEPSMELLDKVEQFDVSKWLLWHMQGFDSFVCRPPFPGGTVFGLSGGGLPGGLMATSLGKANFNDIEDPWAGASGDPWSTAEAQEVRAAAQAPEPRPTNLWANWRPSSQELPPPCSPATAAPSSTMFGGSSGSDQPPHLNRAGLATGAISPSGASTAEVCAEASAASTSSVVEGSLASALPQADAAAAIHAIPAPGDEVSAPTFRACFHDLGTDDSDAEHGGNDPLSKLPGPNSAALAEEYDQW